MLSRGRRRKENELPGEGKRGGFNGEKDRALKKRIRRNSKNCTNDVTRKFDASRREEDTEPYRIMGMQWESFAARWQ